MSVDPLDPSDPDSLDREEAPFREGIRRIAEELERLGIPLPEKAAVESDLDIDRLGARERAVARQLLRGHDVQAIARLEGISPHTVRNHLKSIRQKLGARSLIELVCRLGPYASVV